MFTHFQREKISNLFFYIALTIEVVLMIVEKTAVSSAYDSYVFRIAFLFAFISVILKKHDIREWIIIFIFWAFTVFCYKLSGRNDLLRIVTFLMAARDIDLEKTMKYFLALCGIGFSIVILLSLTGIYGEAYLIADYGRGNTSELRYTLGFGHPNTLFGGIYTLYLLWIWIYAKVAKPITIVAVSAITILFSMITVSRTGMIISILTAVIVLIVKIFPALENSKYTYLIVNLCSPLSCALISVYASICSAYSYIGPGYPSESLFWTIERHINFRLSNLYYSSEDHGGIIIYWKLFADSSPKNFFDMGWIRLFYWYGIIPTVLIIMLLTFLVYLCWKRRDLWTPVLLISIGVYTIIEATFVSRYIGRNILLPIMGSYIGYYFKTHVKSSQPSAS